MKIEFLADGAVDCPLVRLFDYADGEVEQLAGACRDLAEGRRVEFALHAASWVQPVGGCSFIWRRGNRDVGVRLPSPGRAFVLELSDEGWREVEGKLLPFAEGDLGHNWLTIEGDVKVLISRDGTW